MFQGGAAAGRCRGWSASQAGRGSAEQRYAAAVTRESDAPRTPRELHLGVTPWVFEGEGLAGALPEQAALAESLGFDSLFLPESHFAGSASIPSPLLLLAAVAARTTRLRLGTTSFLLPVRNPIHVAEEVAVLDRLSQGRVILGMGRGFRGALFTAFEVPPEEKRDRFEAALQVMRRAWAGEAVAWEAGVGEAAPPTPVHVAPLPVQQPHPPLVGGGLRSQGRRAGGAARASLSRVADRVARGARGELRAPPRGARRGDGRRSRDAHALRLARRRARRARAGGARAAGRRAREGARLEPAARGGRRRRGLGDRRRVPTRWPRACAAIARSSASRT